MRSPISIALLRRWVYAALLMALPAVVSAEQSSRLLNLQALGAQVTISGDSTQVRFITLPTPFTKVITALQAQPELAALDLSGTTLIDLTPLAHLPRLHALDLSSTAVRDLTPLAELNHLRKLILTSTRVQDLAPLAALSGLEILDLGFTSINDIRALAGLSRLRILKLGLTKVSNVQPLQQLHSLQTLDLSFYSGLGTESRDTHTSEAA